MPLSHTLMTRVVSEVSAPGSSTKGTHLCRLHEVSHVPQPSPQLLDLGHRNPFEFGDNGNLGIQVLLLVAFLDDEGPPKEEVMGSMVCPQHMVSDGKARSYLLSLSPSHTIGSQWWFKAPASSPSFSTPNTLHRPEAQAIHQRASALMGVLIRHCGLGDVH